MSNHHQEDETATDCNELNGNKKEGNKPVAKPAQELLMIEDASEADKIDANQQRKLSFNPADIHILVVDDDATARLTVCRCLHKCGYAEVTVVDSGAKALELLADPSRFHLVITDVHMPVMNGMQLLESIRTNKSLSDMPVIMMSATEDLDIVYQCLENGADDYIIKPIRAEILKNLWQNVWRKRKEKRFMTLLTNEKDRRTQMDSQMEQMKAEIAKLKNQVSEAVETPITIIYKTLGDLMNKDSLSDDVRSSLATILKSLQSSNLYKPAFAKVLSDHSSTLGLDNTIRTWLETQFSYSQETPPVDRWPEASSFKSNELLRTLEFNVWSHNEDELLQIVLEMFQDFDLLNKFNIPMEKMHQFLLEVRRGYSKKNPYHNFRHSVDVTHCIYLVLATTNAASMLSYLGMLSLLIAGLCHDLEHPGLNNAFQIQTQSHLALRYNDRSVLENYHCSMTFSLLRKPDCNILLNLTPAELKEVRTTVIGCILATDLAVHHEILTKFNNVIPIYSRENREHRQLLAEIIIKCADISNPVRPFPIAKYWAEMVQEEFFSQGDIEKERMLPVTPFMDRNNKDLPKMQVNFIDFLVSPLFTSFAKLIQGQAYCDNLMLNRQKWAQLSEQAATNTTT